MTCLAVLIKRKRKNAVNPLKVEIDRKTFPPEIGEKLNAKRYVLRASTDVVEKPGRAAVVYKCGYYNKTH